MAGFSEMVKINIHNSSTANVPPLLESVRFRAEQPSVSFAENMWLQFTVVHGKSVLSELVTLEFQHLNELKAKTSYQIMSSPCTVRDLQHRLHKILLQVFPQNLDWRLTSCTQEELKNYHPGFGVSEQKPQCLLAHMLSKQCYLQHRLWFQEASVGLSENVGCRGTPAAPTTEGTDLQKG